MILLTGGTGSLGTLLRERLLDMNYPVRVMTRGVEDWRGSGGVGQLRRRGIDTVLVDLRNPGKVASAVEGCDAVINTCGIIQERKDATFEGVHVEGLRNLVSAAEVYGVQRFLHVSCLGHAGDEDGGYIRSKRIGDEMVKQGQFFWTIFRPTFMFGERCRLVDLLLPVIKAAPVVPIIGSGLNQFQPVSMEDVADCIIQSIYNKTTVGQTYDIAGPQSYSLIELVQLIANALGKPKATVNIPLNVAMKAVKMTGRVMPTIKLSTDMIDLLVSDSVADTTIMRKTFVLKMIGFEECLPALVAKG